MSRRSDRRRRDRRRDRIAEDRARIFAPSVGEADRKPRRVIGGVGRGGVAVRFAICEPGVAIITLGQEHSGESTVIIEATAREPVTAARLLGAVTRSEGRGGEA